MPLWHFNIELILIVYFTCCCAKRLIKTFVRQIRETVDLKFKKITVAHTAYPWLWLLRFRSHYFWMFWLTFSRWNYFSLSVFSNLTSLNVSQDYFQNYFFNVIRMVSSVLKAFNGGLWNGKDPQIATLPNIIIACKWMVVKLFEWSALPNAQHTISSSASSCPARLTKLI